MENEQPTLLSHAHKHIQSQQQISSCQHTTNTCHLIKISWHSLCHPFSTPFLFNATISPCFVHQEHTYIIILKTMYWKKDNVGYFWTMHIWFPLVIHKVWSPNSAFLLERRRKTRVILGQWAFFPFWKGGCVQNKSSDLAFCWKRMKEWQWDNMK